MWKPVSIFISVGKLHRLEIVIIQSGLLSSYVLQVTMKSHDAVKGSYASIVFQSSVTAPTKWLL